MFASNQKHAIIYSFGLKDKLKHENNYQRNKEFEGTRITRRSEKLQEVQESYESHELQKLQKSQKVQELKELQKSNNESNNEFNKQILNSIDNTECSIESILNNENTLLDHESKFKTTFNFDPIEILYRRYDKDFLTLSNLDFIFNFTQTLGNFLAPQDIDNNFHAFNLTSKKGFINYFLYRRPQGYVFIMEDTIDIKELKNQDNIQVFSKPESFIDIRRTGQYPDVIIIEGSFLNFFDKKVFSKLIMHTRGIKYHDRVSFFIFDLNKDFKIFEYISYFELLLKTYSSLFFVLPYSIPYYENRYFICFMIDPESQSMNVKTGNFISWLENIIKVKRLPNFQMFPYKYIIDWNIW